jgi:hypothetical protein
MLVLRDDIRVAECSGSERGWARVTGDDKSPVKKHVRYGSSKKIREDATE